MNPIDHSDVAWVYRPGRALTASICPSGTSGAPLRPCTMRHMTSASSVVAMPQPSWLTAIN